MARRVKQADGSYCYTENCRIHDRALYDSTGLEAVLADAKETQRQQFTSATAQIFQRKLEVSEKKAQKFAEQTIDTMLGVSGEPSMYVVLEELQRLVMEETLGSYSWHTMDTAKGIHGVLRQQRVISQGDEVILKETGERGTITEGNTTFGGSVRFNPEGMHSPNSFKWFKASDVTKITADQNSLARERILAAPRDALIPTYLVKQMIMEETNKRTRNPQAAREFNKFGDAVHSKSAMLDFCDDLRMEYGEKGMTKRTLLKALRERVDTPYQGLGAALPQANKGFRNILNYLDPQQQKPSGQ
jgi:hypothetical protein